jgi:hypothetical protein
VAAIFRAAPTSSNRSSSAAACRRPPAQVQQISHQPQVLLAGEQVVHRGELAGDADRGADRGWVASQVVPGHLDLPAVRRDQRGQYPDHGRLASPVRPEQREHGPAGHCQVDVIEHDLLAERLAQPGHRDARPG